MSSEAANLLCDILYLAMMRAAKEYRPNTAVRYRRKVSQNQNLTSYPLTGNLLTNMAFLPKLLKMLKLPNIRKTNFMYLAQAKQREAARRSVIPDFTATEVARTTEICQRPFP